MSCLLCFSVKSDEFIIAVDGAESRELEVAAVLHKYFKILFYVQPQMGYVCRKCWLRVEDFHKFYTKIESLHCPTGDIFSETIFVDKLDVEPDRLAVSVNEDYHSASIPLKEEEDEEQIEEEEEDEAEVDDKLALDEFVLEFSTSQSEPTKAEGNKTSNALNDNLSTNQLRRKTNQWGRRGSEKLRKLRKKIYGKCCMHFKGYRNLYRHIKTEHEMLPFGCKTKNCFNSFATQETLDAHIRDNHKPAECPICKKTMTSHWLRAHIRSLHESNEKIVCDVCGRVSANKPLHDCHYRNMHMTFERVQCDICKHWFKRKDALVIHMRRHLDSPQTCNICGHISPNKDSLKKHVNLHTSERRFKCPTCGKGYRDNYGLREHMNNHTGSTPFHCEYCGKMYRHSSSYYTHKKNCVNNPSKKQ